MPAEKPSIARPRMTIVVRFDGQAREIGRSRVVAFDDHAHLGVESNRQRVRVRRDIRTDGTDRNEWRRPARRTLKVRSIRGEQLDRPRIGSVQQIDHDADCVDGAEGRLSISRSDVRQRFQGRLNLGGRRVEGYRTGCIALERQSECSPSRLPDDLDFSERCLGSARSLRTTGCTRRSRPGP